MQKLIILVLAVFIVYFILRFFAEKQSKQLLLRKYKDVMSIIDKLKLVKLNLGFRDSLIVIDDGISGESNLFGGQKAVSLNSFFKCIVEKDRKRILDEYKKIIQGESNQFTADYGFIPIFGTSPIWCRGIFFVRDRDLSGKPINLIGIIKIINEYKEEIDNLIKEKQEKEKENFIQSEFISNIDYEIRTPLNAIMGFSDLLSEVKDEKQKEYCLSMIKANNEALLQSVNNLLDFYCMKSTSVVLEECDMDVNREINELKEKFTPLLSPDVKFYFTEQMAECVIIVDVKRFERAMSILIDNAIKNTIHGNICIGYHVILGNMLYFYVSDTGSGIELDKQQSLFSIDDFSQNKHVGWGLLLFKVIVQKMGGGLGVKSQLGVGSEFWFTIPYKKA